MELSELEQHVSKYQCKHVCRLSVYGLLVEVKAYEL